ncbi:hypothetical protein V6N13_147602 [Hibiscus sabdariffa]
MDIVLVLQEFKKTMPNSLLEAAPLHSHIGISSKKFRSHYASSLDFSRATNSDSIVSLVITVCLEDFLDTSLHPKIKTYPLVPLVS